MALIDGMRVRWSLTAFSSKELPTYQAAVDVRARLERDTARGLEVKIQRRSIDGVQVGTFCLSLATFIVGVGSC